MENWCVEKINIGCLYLNQNFYSFLTNGSTVLFNISKTTQRNINPQLPINERETRTKIKIKKNSTSNAKSVTKPDYV